MWSVSSIHLKEADLPIWSKYGHFFSSLMDKEKVEIVGSLL